MFDSSIARGQPAEFPLNGVIPCWTEGVQTMKVGGKAQLTCPAELAYGPNGHPPAIPPQATLVFDVELLDIVKPEAPKPAPAENDQVTHRRSGLTVRTGGIHPTQAQCANRWQVVIRANSRESARQSGGMVFPGETSPSSTLE